MASLRMKIAFLFISLIFVTQSAWAQLETSVYTKRGLVKEIFSEADPHFDSIYRTIVRLKGVADRAACPRIILSQYDKSGLEILKLAMQLNRPVEIRFHVAKGNSEEVAEDPIHCQAEGISLKP